MVNKIFKAASKGNQSELDQLFEQVEKRAHEMIKTKELESLPMPSDPVPPQTRPTSDLPLY